MALAYTENVKAEAEAIAAVANELVSLYHRVNQILEHNSDLAADWTAGATPGYISEAASGNMTGLPYTRQQIGNAIGSFSQFKNYMTNAAVTQGDHLGNFDLVSRPLG